jgi:hypothetical protein
VSVKSLVVTFEFKAKVRHGKVAFKTIPKLVVKEFHVKSSLYIYWQFRQDTIIIQVYSNILVITPPIVEVVDYPLAELII